jgi:hypothetical protein
MAKPTGLRRAALLVIEDLGDAVFLNRYEQQTTRSPSIRLQW